MRLVILTNILAPYRLPLFEAMQHRVERFTVLLMAEQEENRLWRLGQHRFNCQVLSGFHIKPKGADVSLHFNYGVIRALRKISPDVVLSAGFAPANLLALLYCKLFQKKYVQWAHLTLQDGAVSSILKRTLRRWMTTWSDGSIGESSHAREAFIQYGATPDRVLTATMPLNVTHLHEQTLELRNSAECKALRKKFSRPILLSIGQIIQRKGYQELFNIYQKIVKARPEVSLLIVGDGPDRSRYEAFTDQHDWKNVHFIGFVQTDELPKYLALGDAFVFHTLYDPFGLVLSEAMAAELPVVSSIYASATHDLIQDGMTGFRIDPKDAESSATTILKLLDMPLEKRAEMTRAAYSRVLRCDTTPTAQSMIKFMQSLLNDQRGNTVALH